ncbi:MAG: methyl-accepting chemotaxis protein [Pirellulaceae bacterium]|nr:methyl-accepting chemotaxis protein [Pirellulaceae bacterium]
MSIAKSLSPRSWFTIFLSGCILTSVLLGAFAMRVAGLLKVDGPVVGLLVDSKDLLADILPPPHCIIESYVKASQACQATNEREREEAIASIGKLKSDYYASQERWKAFREKQLLKQRSANSEESAVAKQLYDTLLVKSHLPAEQFFQEFERRLVPAIQANDSELAQEIFLSSLKPAFEEHRQGIDEATQFAVEYSKGLEGVAKAQGKSFSTTLSALLLTVIGGFCGMGLYFYRLQNQTDKVLANLKGQLTAIDASQATIEFNLDGTIITANKNFLNAVGYSLDEIVGKHHSMFVDTAYANSVEYRNFWEELRAGKFHSAQCRRLAKGGKVIWIQATYNPILDRDGRPYKVVKYAMDITAAKQMEFEMAEAQKRDAAQAIDIQNKVNEILTVANKVAQRDYTQQLSVSGSDVIGRLGEGLAQFFANKQATELREQQRNDQDRAQAEEMQRKVAVVLQIVNSVADGKFDVSIPNLGDDAIGQVASALQQAVNSMQLALGEVRDVSSTVSSAAEQLTAVSREITAGAQTQASSLEETASSLEEITSTVKQNSDNAQHARQLANGSRDIAEKGGSVVSEAVQAMGEINQSSKRIADIITTIDEIAFQTNLLALNAAVEAARAGEQGRGFAVVAAEVRNLAQRSASAAKEIKTLIQDSVRKVENGTDLVNKSGQTLSEIVNSVKRVTDIVSEIAAASKEQLTGIEQVNKAVSQMDRVTQANAAQTEEMSGTASALLSHAVQLRDLVGRFQLEPESVHDNRTPKGNREPSQSQRSVESKPRTRAIPVPLSLNTTFETADQGVLEF